MPRRDDIVEKAWDFDDVNWDEYESHRPPYTKAMYDLLFNHHEQYGGKWNNALDVGAGGGTVTLVLLKKFDHVIMSDASADYVSRGQNRFSKEADAGAVTFMQRRFDEFKPDEDLPDSEPIDMITAGTCIHFGKPAHIMAQLGPLLRSGGTITAFSYGATPIGPLGDPATQIIKDCKEKIMRWIDANIHPITNVEGTGTAQSRYHNVDFDPEMWTNVRRITSLPHEHAWPEWIQPAISRVRDNESIEVVDDDFMTREVDYEFFPAYFHYFAPPLKCLDQIPEELEKLKLAMGSRKITVKWPFMMVVGTKR